MAKNLVSIDLDNTEYSLRPHGTCSTAATTAAKTVAITDFTLCTGATILVKFSNSNTIDNPTLNVNGTGNKPIIHLGHRFDSSIYYEFIYNGSNWVQIGDGGIKIGYVQSDQNYPVQLDSNNKAYVNVPWTDTKVTQTITDTNDDYPLLLAPSGQTTTTTTTSYFDSEVTLNPSTNCISGVALSIKALPNAWLGGLTNASIKYNNLESLNNSNYYPVLGIKTNNGNVVSFGGYRNQVGFYGYEKDQTDNATKWKFELDSNNGAIASTGSITTDSNLTVKGNTTLGDEASDTVTVNGETTFKNRLVLSPSNYNNTIKIANTDFPAATSKIFMGANGDFVIRSTFASDSSTSDLRWNKKSLKIGNEEVLTGTVATTAEISALFN